MFKSLLTYFLHVPSDVITDGIDVSVFRKLCLSIKNFVTMRVGTLNF